MDKFIDKRLDGRYLIKALIGAGGMANVYKAVDLKENRLVAVKILKEECMKNEELVRRFKNESKAISLLDNPHIVKVYDVSVTDKLQYIAMEYVDGITLKEYMEYRKQPLTYKETLHFITQTLDALRHAHEKGIVHRDIKPQNIMLLADGNIKVMDFGIARLSRSENQTMTDKAIGSVHYISPEQAKGDVTDAKADIYSVGIMMYEMLAGRLPFDSDSPVSVAIKQISDTAAPLRSVNPAVPEALEAITNRAMAKEPGERYQSAGEMLADIEAFKRNPSVKFEYDYLKDTDPTRYIDKVVNKTARTSKSPSSQSGRSRTTRSSRPSSSGGSSAAAKRKKKNSFSEIFSRYSLPVLAGVALAFAVAASILVVMIFKTNANGLFAEREDLELPNLVNRMWSDVKNDASLSNFVINVDEVYSADYEAGTIIYQSPKPPKTVKAGSTINIRVSKGAEIVTVPNIIGWTKEDAQEELENAGVTYIMRSRVDSSVAVGQICAVTYLDSNGAEQDATHQQVSASQTITVYVSKEEIDTSTSVPTVIGLDVNDAYDLIVNKHHLTIGSIETVDNTAPAGTVLSITPGENTQLNWGDVVTLQVSSGHEHSYVESDIITPATCTQNGKRWYRCACGDAYEAEYAADLNDVSVHTKDGVSTIDPKTGTCSQCGAHNDAWITDTSSSSSSSSSAPASSSSSQPATP